MSSNTPPPKSHIIDLNNSDELIPDAIVHTTKLLISLLKGLVADGAGRLCLLYDHILARILANLPPKIPWNVIDSLLSSRLKDLILGPTFRVCMTAFIEKPHTEHVIWGLTNWKKDNWDEVGYLIPAINLALCEAYDGTYIDDEEANVVIRGQLGSLIIITLLHELAHTFLRQTLKGIVDDDWRTPDITGAPDGEAGDELEEAIFGGKVVTVWKNADIGKSKRFNMIDNFWIQPSMGRMSVGKMHLIPPGHLVALHNRILSTKFDLDDLRSVFEDSNIYTTAAQLFAENMVAMRASSSRAVMEGVAPDLPPRIDPLEYPPFCLIGLERAASRDPRVYEKYFQVD
ncbi:hypothetical protein B0H12DRAFT_1123588 [Mycena haematopus]|nr:hypothetical protein B0H12DRAFT_1123588 [Mycena haematopus]